MSGWVMQHREPVVIEDIFTDPRIPHDVYRPTFVRSMAMVPIRRLDPLGAIGNYWATPHRATAEELELLQALADTTAVAMENVRFYEQLRDSQLETLQRLALVAEYRDDNTYQHTERVARTAYLLAERLGLSHRGGGRHPPGRAAARRRQAGRARFGAAQARPADRRRVRADQAPHRGGRGDLGRQQLRRPAPRRGDRPQPPRALGRRRLSQRAGPRERSRSAGASSPWPTSSMPSPTPAATSRPGTPTGRSRRSCACAAASSTPTWSTPSPSSTRRSLVELPDDWATRSRPADLRRLAAPRPTARRAAPCRSRTPRRCLTCSCSLGPSSADRRAPPVG